MKNALEIINNAVAAGIKINFDVSPYNTTGSLLYLLIPAWAREGGFNDLFKRLEDQWQREKIIIELQASTLHYDKIFIVSAKTPGLAGKTLAEIAESSGMSPEETLLQTVRANEGRVTILGKTVSSKNTALQIKNTDSIIASDGAGYGQNEAKTGNLVHPRSFGAFPHFWHRFVNDLKILTPEEAIKKRTRAQAEKMKIDRRGSLAKGNFADIVIFDSRLVRDRANYQNPFKYPAGIEYVIVNGKIAVENGRYLGVRAGKVLRRIS